MQKEENLRGVEVVKKLITIMLLVFLATALAGCGKLSVDLNKDGSGTATYSINAGPMATTELVKQRIQTMIDQFNQTSGAKTISLKKMTEKNGTIQATIRFKNLSAIGSDSFIVPLPDLIRYQPKAVKALKKENGSPALNLQKLNHSSKNSIAVYLDGLDGSTDITIHVPGKISYLSDGVQLVHGKKDTVQVNGSTAIIVFQPSGGFPALTIILLLVAAALIAGGIWYYRHKKSVEPFKVGEVNEA